LAWDWALAWMFQLKVTPEGNVHDCSLPSQTL
jgi:hypothetical protein